MTQRYCRCGHPIRIEYQWNGLVYRVRFEDANGNEIDECPGCGQNVTAWLDGGDERMEVNDALLREAPQP